MALDSSLLVLSNCLFLLSFFTKASMTGAVVATFGVPVDADCVLSTVLSA